MKIENVLELQEVMSEMFSHLTKIQLQIKEELKKHSDGKTLKGNELVGWLGEIYAKYLFDGILVDDRFEHDVETKSGNRISVKTRKGFNSGWRQSSAIPKIDGETRPTHFLFVHLNDDYTIDRIWLFEWDYLRETDRFRDHNVRGNKRSSVFYINDKTDTEFLIFDFRDG